MTKIPLEKQKCGSEKRYGVSMTFKFGHSIKPIQAIFDTGASAPLIITQRDTERLQIPLKSLEKDGVTHLGGLKHNAFRLNNVRIYMKDEEDKSKTITLPEVKILKCTSKSPRKENQAYKLPNLIGLNFIEETGWKFHLNKNGAYFEY